MSKEQTATPAPPTQPEGEQEKPIRRMIGSSRHPHFTHADHERMKETLDALSDYPTEEEAEAVLQACGTSGKEVVNGFIDRLLQERSEMQAEIDKLRAAARLVPPKDDVVDEVQRRMDQVAEAAVEWHQAGREGAEWFEAAERLGAAIDSLLELRDAPHSDLPRRHCAVHNREEFKYESLEHELHAEPVTTTTTARAAAEEIVAQMGETSLRPLVDKTLYFVPSATVAERGILTEKFTNIISKHFPTAAIEAGGDDRPRIICLCGSTRFIEQFAITTWELEREGYIVLGCTLLPMWYCNTPSHFGEATGTKEQCDELHKRKIDLADEVLVLNIGGYIGESTKSEIDYAMRLGKPVRYIESVEAARNPEGEGK